jgi:hypothetical protein
MTHNTYWTGLDRETIELKKKRSRLAADGVIRIPQTEHQ